MDLEHFKTLQGLSEDQVLEKYYTWIQHELDFSSILVNLIKEKTKNISGEVYLRYGDNDTFQYLIRYDEKLYVGCAFEDSCAFSYPLDTLELSNLVSLLKLLNNPENSHLWVDNCDNKG